MAWIESHQALRDHPKVARLCRLLDCSRIEAVGMLHLLWWWALDHAEDGDVSDYDSLDLALAADWEGEPEVFVKALLTCGPGSRDGFLADEGGRLVLHDWWEYAGKLVARRRQDRERKATARALAEQGVHGTSSGHPTEVSESPSATEQNQPTEPTEPTSLAERREDVDHLCDVLADLIEANGSIRPKITKAWRDECRRMLDIDGRDPVKAENLMRWCQADPFWRSNVLSMSKFRDQYDQLRLKGLEATSPKPSKSTPQSRTAENAQRVRLAIAGGSQ